MVDDSVSGGVVGDGVVVGDSISRGVEGDSVGRKVRVGVGGSVVVNPHILVVKIARKINVSFTF